MLLAAPTIAGMSVKITVREPRRLAIGGAERAWLILRPGQSIRFPLRRTIVTVVCLAGEVSVSHRGDLTERRLAAGNQLCLSGKGRVSIRSDTIATITVETGRPILPPQRRPGQTEERFTTIPLLRV